MDILKKYKETNYALKKELAETKSDLLYYKSRYIQIFDLIEDYKKSKKNPYQVLRDISNNLYVLKKGLNDNEHFEDY